MSIEHDKVKNKEEEENSEEEPSKLSLVHFMYAMGTEMSEDKHPSNELMYVEVWINGKNVRAMVDTGVTHNFITEDIANQLGLKVVRGGGCMKVINSKARPIHGITKNVEVKIGDWSGTLNFTVATMDDFEMVLGMDFLHVSKAVSMPHLGSLLVASNHPCLLWTCPQIKKGKGQKGPLLYVMQLQKGMKRNEPTILANLSVKEDETGSDLPLAMEGLLEEFADLLPKGLPKALLPRRAIDHTIELVPRSRPPARSPYRMAPLELTELPRQLDE